MAMEGDTAADVRFRRAGTRGIRVIDERGSPVSGVTVKVYRFWSDENHCGRLSGGELLVESPSGADGFVRIPDGDFEYAILVPDWRDFLLVEHNCCDYAGWVTFLDRETTDIVVHRFEVHPLRMQILEDGHPACRNESVGHSPLLHGGTCGACYGVVCRIGSNGTNRHQGLQARNRQGTDDFEVERQWPAGGEHPVESAIRPASRSAPRKVSNCRNRAEPVCSLRGSFEADTADASMETATFGDGVRRAARGPRPRKWMPWAAAAGHIHSDADSSEPECAGRISRSRPLGIYPAETRLSRHWRFRVKGDRMTATFSMPERPAVRASYMWTAIGRR